MRGFLLFLCAFSVAVGWQPVPCRAETISLCDAASSDDYLTKTSGQFLRGTTGIAFCWLEMIGQPAAEVRSGGNVVTGGFPSVTRDCPFGSVGLEDH